MLTPTYALTRIAASARPFFVRMSRPSREHHVSTPEPLALTLAGFRLTVLGREFPHHHDYWDGNWLQVVAVCADESATASAKGPFVRTDEIAALAAALQALLDGSTGAERLNLLEQELAFAFARSAADTIAFSVKILPDDPSGMQWFTFDVAAADVAAAIQQCRAILDAFPIRDSA